jgi:hypothetical protein
MNLETHHENFFYPAHPRHAHSPPPTPKVVIYKDTMNMVNGQCFGSRIPDPDPPGRRLSACVPACRPLPGPSLPAGLPALLACPPIHLSACRVSVCMPVRLAICPSGHLSDHLSACLYVCLLVYLPADLPACLACLLVCLPVCLLACLTACLLDLVSS